jgi:hypothetical protein
MPSQKKSGPLNGGVGHLWPSTFVWRRFGVCAFDPSKGNWKAKGKGKGTRCMIPVSYGSVKIEEP